MTMPEPDECGITVIENTEKGDTSDASQTA